MAQRIAQARLHNQHLIATPFTDPADVVRVLGVVQSQDYPGAKWALARRTRGVTDADVERAFTAGAILRTHVLRPTWHFVAPEDIRWMLALTAPRVSQAMAYYFRSWKLDRAVLKQSNAAIERALRDGKQLTRKEIESAVVRAGVKVGASQRLIGMLMQAELDALVCSGARRDKQFTYALLDERVPAVPPRDRDDALQELARRYFTTRGPATVHDFSWWSGLTVADAKRAVEAAGSALTRESTNDKSYWSAPPTPAARGGGRAPRMAHLLPNYDEYFIGFRDRSAIAERIGRVKSAARLNALMGHVLFIDGQIVGGWRRTLGANVDVTFKLLVPLSASERRLVNTEIARFSAFLELPARAKL